MQTPILLISFNRPAHTKKVLEAVFSQKPHDLYVFQDGARPGNGTDLEKCLEVRRVIMDLVAHSPNTTVHCFFSEENLGCGPGPARAISWFFENVEQGIILEDDAVPHPDFFVYSEELLERFKDDPSVHAIGSMNVDTKKWGDGSYYFSMMNRNLCAWATWRRAWRLFDIEMKGVTRRQLSRALHYYKCGLLERSFWCDRLAEVHKDGCGGKSWDMQFFMSIWLNHGKGIIPNVNLSSNIGTVDEATHRMAPGNIIDSIPTQPILPLRHPSSGRIQYIADQEFHFRYFERNKKNWPFLKTIQYVLNKSVKRFVGHQGPWIKKK